ncbi:MAG TPA: hypothetical protein VFR35_18655, partial [Actinoplanes sp.]|nr:hypothetical protein [Actinoplanes sp.]
MTTQTQPALVRRLAQRAEQPGLVRHRQSAALLGRHRTMAAPLPLAGLARRADGVEPDERPPSPIVYADLPGPAGPVPGVALEPAGTAQVRREPADRPARPGRPADPAPLAGPAATAPPDAPVPFVPEGGTATTPADRSEPVLPLVASPATAEGSPRRGQGPAESGLPGRDNGVAPESAQPDCRTGVPSERPEPDRAATRDGAVPGTAPGRAVPDRAPAVPGRAPDRGGPDPRYPVARPLSQAAAPGRGPAPGTTAPDAPLPLVAVRPEPAGAAGT